MDTRYEENKRAESSNEQNWIEVRLQGKLPERRSNHTAFILKQKDNEYMYIHGGRDLKEGSISTMWRVSLTGIRTLFQDNYHNVEWECVNTTGRGPGKISHHTVSILSQKEVLFYGGLKGEDNNADIFLFNAMTNAWSTVRMAEATSPDILPRDDHSMCDLDDGGFLVFGGFVNGSRTNELLQFRATSMSVNAEILCKNDLSRGPPIRASHSSAFHNGQFFVFGGQDDDNNKLGDLWSFDTTTKKWTELTN